MTTLKLSRSQLLYVFVTVLIVLPLALGFAFERELYGVYLVQLRGPELQRQFGFTAGEIQMARDTGQPASVFAITTLVPGGRLARAGFRAGDIPVGYTHGFASGFYQDLAGVLKGESTVISVIAMEDYSRGISAWRRVKVQALKEQ